MPHSLILFLIVSVKGANSANCHKRDVTDLDTPRFTSLQKVKKKQKEEETVKNKQTENKYKNGGGGGGSGHSTSNMVEGDHHTTLTLTVTVHCVLSSLHLKHPPY